ncbi:hypothetical protein EAO24_17945 [Klebsiella pneumoniae]|nr:hypothetical protein EAO24_17945 [Klebsiella pneumoniae]RRE56475.1 hypothetical protein EAO06_27070 [Klebsiella pneumoniae]
MRRIFMHANAIFIRVNEIYAWCGQTPCVMSVTAVRQRASHVPGLPNVVRVITGWALAVKAQSRNRSREGIQRDNNNGR